MMIPYRYFDDGNLTENDFRRGELSNPDSTMFHPGYLLC